MAQTKCDQDRVRSRTTLWLPPFRRLPRGMHPTDPGHRSARLCRARARGPPPILRGPRAQEPRRQWTLVIGTSLGAATDNVVRAIAELKQCHPLVSIKLLDSTTDELLSLLLAHKLDLAIGRFDHLMQHKLISYENLGFDVLHIIARTNHPATRLPGLNLRSLQHYPWVLSRRAYGDIHAPGNGRRRPALRRTGMKFFRFDESLQT
jgi:DNA-binding transcriptional LysR family regulator